MILTVLSQKGGAGKTTTAAALAQAAAHNGIHTLLIDADPQCNLSFITGAASDAAATIYNVLQGSVTAAEAIRSINKDLGIIQGSAAMQTLSSEQGSGYRLQQALRPVKKGYRLIIIDTPPQAGEILINCLLAADKALIPVSCDALGAQGLYAIAGLIKQIQGIQTASKISVAGFIFTRHSERTTLSRQLSEDIRAQAENLGIPYLGSVRDSVKLREAQALQQDLYSYAGDSNPAKDYNLLLHSILKK